MCPPASRFDPEPKSFAELDEIFPSIPRDDVKNGFIQFTVFVKRDIPETGHGAEMLFERLWNDPGFAYEGKGVTTVFGHAEAPFGNEVHGKVYGSLADAFDVQGQRVCMGIVAQGRIRGIFLTDPPDASLDNGGFVQRNVIRRCRHVPPRSFAVLILGKATGP